MQSSDPQPFIILHSDREQQAFRGSQKMQTSAKSIFVCHNMTPGTDSYPALFELQASYQSANAWLIIYPPPR